MSRTKGIGVALVVLLLVSALSTPAPAAVTRTPLDVYIAACVQDPGEVWYTGEGGRILHVRGLVQREFLYDTGTHALVGDLISVVSYEMNLVQGTGGVNVSFSAFLHDISIDDPFLGTVAGRIHDFKVDARVIAHGTGEAKGVRRKGRLVSVDVADVPGAVLVQLPCFPDGGIYLATGTLEDSR